MDRIMRHLAGRTRSLTVYLWMLAKWILVGAEVGLVGGLVGALFHLGVDAGAHYRALHPEVLYLLPVGGLVIVALYKLCRVEGRDTNDIIDSVQFGSHIPLLLVPVIFVSTVITHLVGGSAGREGAALQIGGGIGYKVGRMAKVHEKDLPLCTMCGMSGVFAALFGTPLAAVIFSLEVISVGVLYYAGLVPCLSAALSAYWVAGAMGVAPTRFALAEVSLQGRELLLVVVLAAVCAVVSALFCRALRLVHHGLEKRLPNPWLRAALGGGALIALTLLFGTDYNGAGMELIALAVAGTAVPWAWVLKILFTAVTMGCGFKGGEVMPSFFIGATLGCTVGGLLGLPPSLGAAVGLVSVFCGAVNCPVASMFLALELFGGTNLLYFAVACAVSYMLSGYSGLYGSQRILYSKLRAEFIDHHAT